MDSLKKLIESMEPGEERALYAKIYYNLELAVAQPILADLSLVTIEQAAGALKRIDRARRTNAVLLDMAEEAEEDYELRHGRCR
jgi:hypothetical protein